MQQNVEVAVVGAGMFGSAAAKYLSRAGADVMVIGSGKPDGEGRGGGGLAQFGAHHDEARIVRRMGWDPFWAAVDSRSAGRLRGIEAASGITCYHECGALALMAGSIRPRTQAMLSASKADGVTVHLISDADLRREFPALGVPPLADGVDGLLEREGAGYLNPRRLVEAQLALTTASGGRILRGAVTGIRRDEAAGLWRLQVTGGDGRHRVGAEKVLVAAGALLNQSGALPPGHTLDLRAFTEPNLLYEVDAGRLGPLRDLPTVVTVDPEDAGNANLSHYLLPPVRYPDGKWYVRIGPGMQPVVRELRTQRETHAWYAGQRVTPEQGALLARMMRLMVPGLAPVSVREACCVVDKTPTRYPYIGHLDADRTLAVAVGGNGHGARGSDEIGRLASALVLGRPWDFPLPQETFAPMAAPSDQADRGTRPDYLKPPFGLC
ncbi:FAD-dependent oxidoreductase [Streptomyces sp. MZ04]|uniref:NAD(P)/FAD-dependent oxidoreductase n=1 Tax=Streptomyces sp. MZ04 TaxID=2559236 RepID=UPI0014330A8C|nr:FAD-dependent oxidoreductase [Streptomyces sp. MZ04]